MIVCRSIAFFPHSELSWELLLVSGLTLNVESLERPDLRHFFERVAGHVLPAEQGGHVDFFSPLGASGT